MDEHKQKLRGDKYNGIIVYIVTYGKEGDVFGPSDRGPDQRKHFKMMQEVKQILSLFMLIV